MDVEIGDGAQLAGIGGAIAIAIDPDAQAVKLRITGIDEVVTVAVESSQSGEAIHHGIAELFTEMVDAAVVVEITHQQALACANPADAFAEAIVVEIEVCLGPL